MAAQEQATRTAIAAICSHLPSAADAAAKALCIENLTAENPALAHTSLASLGRWVLCLTAIKFMFGFALMTKYAGRIQPFDLLIISGAAHCLALVSDLIASVPDRTVSLIARHSTACSSRLMRATSSQ